MQEYAFSLALKKHYPNEEILLDIQHLESLYEHGFEIKKVFPNLDCKIATKKQINKVSRYVPNYKLSRIVRRLLPKKRTEYVEARESDIFDSKVFDLQGDVYYEGYWHAYKYYEDIIPEIRSSFVPTDANEYNAGLINDIEKENSVGIHVRRGDYLQAENASLAGACNLDYYKAAISELYKHGSDYHFYIFSNDIDWCKKEILPLLKTDKVTFVTGNTGIHSCWDMFLMSHCKKLIIANSSFSWWGAMLNKNNPTVIVPKYWRVGDSSESFCAPDWIRL